MPYQTIQTFSGWTLRSNVTEVGIEGEPPEGNKMQPSYSATTPLYANGTELTMTGDVTLFPLIQNGHWLIFDTNIEANNTANGFDDSTSASYTSPVFYTTETNTAAPAVPTRTGYTFGGWYADKAMTTTFTFGSTLSADTTIYAKWTPATTTFKVVIWTQKTSDAVGLADANKTYDLYDYVVYNGSTGATYSVPSGATSLKTSSWTLSSRTIARLGNYFTLNSNLSETTGTVTGDGLATINVYYDRATITINFSNASISTQTNYYEQIASVSEFLNNYPDPNGYYTAGGAQLRVTEGTYNSHPEYYFYNGNTEYANIYYSSYGGWTYSGTLPYLYNPNAQPNTTATYSYGNTVT